MNNVFLSAPPSMHAKQPRSILIVCNTSPSSRTRLQRLLGTSAYQTAFSASRQMPSGAPSPRSAQTCRFDRLPSSAMSKAVSFLPWDSAMIKVELSGVMAIPFGKAIPSATCRAEQSGVTRAMIPGASIDVSIPTTVHDDFVPYLVRDAAQVGVGHQRTAWLLSQNETLPTGDDQQMAIRQPIDAKWKTERSPDYDLFLAFKIDSHDFLSAPVCEPKTPSVPTW